MPDRQSGGDDAANRAVSNAGSNAGSDVRNGLRYFTDGRRLQIEAS